MRRFGFQFYILEIATIFRLLCTSYVIKFLRSSCIMHGDDAFYSRASTFFSSALYFLRFVSLPRLSFFYERSKLSLQ